MLLEVTISFRSVSLCKYFINAPLQPIELMNSSSWFFIAIACFCIEIEKKKIQTEKGIFVNFYITTTTTTKRFKEKY